MKIEEVKKTPKKEGPAKNKSADNKSVRRVAWMHTAAVLLQEHVLPEAPDADDIFWSCGFPSRGAKSGTKKPVLGQCHYCVDGSHESHMVVVHPSEFLDTADDNRSDPVWHDPRRYRAEFKVLAVEAHEIIHTICGLDQGHGTKFAARCKSIGLEGKPTATWAGKEFCDLMEHLILPKLPEFPYGAVTVVAKVQGTRQRKYVCQCKTHGDRPGPWIVRIASDHFKATCNRCKKAFTLDKGKTQQRTVKIGPGGAEEVTQ